MLLRDNFAIKRDKFLWFQNIIWSLIGWMDQLGWIDHEGRVELMLDRINGSSKLDELHIGSSEPYKWFD